MEYVLDRKGNVVLITRYTNVLGIEVLRLKKLVPTMLKFKNPILIMVWPQDLICFILMSILKFSSFLCEIKKIAENNLRRLFLWN